MISSMNEYENKYFKLGYQYIAGIDEAGRGPLAGPVVAACVIFPKDVVLKHVNDSKKLSPKKRELALEEIKEKALSISIGISSVEDIDQINILRATKQAMLSSINGVKVTPDLILIDAVGLDTKFESISIIKGDQLSYSIAAASIVAKTTRDMYMTQMDELYPNYGFNQHKGYGTKKHIEAIYEYGVTPIHRKTFEPIKSILLKKQK